MSSPAAAAFNLTVNGVGFFTGVTLRVNGNSRPTTLVSATRLTAAITAEDIAAAGTLQITVINAGSSPSNSLSLRTYDRVTSVTSSSYSAGDLAPDSILSAFARTLATGVEIAASLPLPTRLLGTRVVVKDSAGVEREQSLFFVAPQQVNYLLHPQTALGPATVTVYINNDIVSLGEINVARLSPGLFTQNATGDGAPAAYGLRLKGGASTLEPVTVVNYDQAAKTWVPAVIDLGADNDQVFLVVFGSGFRRVSGLSAITAKIGNVTIPVLFAGAAPDFVGLDQLNLGPIPRSLVGSGLVNLTVTIDGKVANTGKSIQLNIK